MKIVLILDQIQAGLGGKENGMVPLGGKTMPIGSAAMFEKYLPAVKGEIVATLYCGDDFFLNAREEVSKKFAAMVKKISPDVVICGPAFNYEKYGEMAADTAFMIESKVGIPVVAAMSVECEEAIKAHKEDVDIVKMPKKGGIGLTDALQNILALCQLKVEKGDLTEFKKENCY